MTAMVMNDFFRMHPETGCACGCFRQSDEMHVGVTKCTKECCGLPQLWIAAARCRGGKPPQSEGGSKLPHSYFPSSYKYSTNDITAPSNPCTFGLLDSIR